MRSTLRRLATVAALIALSLAPLPAAAAEGPPAAVAADIPVGTSFYEQFDAGIDPAFWYTADGFNNGAHQNCQFNKNNAKAANGELTLTFNDTPYGDRDYSCADIQSLKKYGYGTYETRMKAGKGSGLNSAFFSYIGPYYNQPWDEIDFEVLGKNTSSVDLNTWVNGASSGGFPTALPYDSSTQYIDFAWIWEPGKLRFYINDTLVKTVTGGQVPSHEQLIIPMIWGSDTLTGWMGEFSYPGHPIEAKYDYIAYTELGDPCPFEGSMACGVTKSFVDDFNTLDTGRWAVSDGWHNGAKQNCTWDKSQVAVADGKLNLSFAKKAYGDRQYACAEVQSRAQLGYGTYEAKMKGVKASGLMSALFTYIGGTPSEAIDIKLLGRDTSKVKFNSWQGTTPYGEKLAALPSAADQNYIDYGLKWSAGKLEFYVNGSLVHTITDPAKIPAKDANLFLTIWGSETLTADMGAFTDPGSTKTFQVDRLAYTAPGEACQFAGSIACA